MERLGNRPMLYILVEFREFWPRKGFHEEGVVIPSVPVTTRAPELQGASKYRQKETVLSRSLEEALY